MTLSIYNFYRASYMNHHFKLSYREMLNIKINQNGKRNITSKLFKEGAGWPRVKSAKVTAWPYLLM